MLTFPFMTILTITNTRQNQKIVDEKEEMIEETKKEVEIGMAIEKEKIKETGIGTEMEKTETGGIGMKIDIVRITTKKIRDIIISRDNKNQERKLKEGLVLRIRLVHIKMPFMA